MDEIREMHELCEILMQNIRDVKQEIKNARLEPEEAEYLNYLLHSLKSSKCVIQIMEREKMDDQGEYGRGGYSDAYSMQPDAGTTYGRRMRGSNGRFMESGYGRAMYRDDGKDQMLEELHRAMNMAKDQSSRRILEEAIQKMDRA